MSDPGAPPTSELPPTRGNRTLKSLDRLLGIPAVAVAGGARRLRRRHLPSDWRRLGLVNTAGIGDVVLSSAIVHDLRRARPDAQLVMFATETNQGFARLVPDLDLVETLPVRDVRRAIARVRAQHLDVCVDLGAWARYDALITATSGARWTVGRRTRGQRRHLAYDAVVDHRTGEHELDNFRRLVAAIGIDATSEPSIPRPAPHDIGERYAVLHLWPGGANASERSWPQASWLALARVFNDRGFVAVLTGGPGDVGATSNLVDAWGASGVRALSAAGASPADCARWLTGSVGVVSVNTGVMHLAAALGCVTVGLHGPTSATRWGPIGPRAVSVVSPDVPNGYLDLGFERDDRFAGCMRGITVDEVVDAWDRVTAATTARDAPPGR